MCCFRCVCPVGTWGPKCKILSRSFTAGDWAWVVPLPHCTQTRISVKFLTKNLDGNIIYAGPLAPPTKGIDKENEKINPMPMINLQLKDGFPQLIVEGFKEPILMTIIKDRNSTMNDGVWHTIDIQLDEKVCDICRRLLCSICLYQLIFHL